MHGAMIGRKDTAGPNGSGFLGENDPSYTLTASQQSRHGVAIAFSPADFGNYSESENIGTLRAGMGNGAEPILAVDEFNFTTSKTHQTLRAKGKDSTGLLNQSIVRRLTPLECERLQGFPDEWTSGQADQHRYKQMGNAVAVPVVEWIVKRLVGAVNERDT